MSTQVVDCGVYVAGLRLPGHSAPRAAMAEVRRRQEGFVWCGLHDPDDDTLAEIAAIFSLPPKATTHAVRVHHRPRLTTYDDQLCMVLKTVRYVADSSPTTAKEIVDSGEIIAFLGADFIVTVRHGNHTGLRYLRTVLEATPERLRHGPTMVLHGIADLVVDNYVAVSESFGNDIDTIEASVFDPRSKVGAEHMYLLKREIVELNQAVVPLVEPLCRLVKSPAPFLAEPVRTYLRDVEDHLTAVSERVASYDELLTSLVTATLAKLSLRQNTDMRKITSWAAIISVPTMVAGAYGMNFDTMPLVHRSFGYPVVVAFMIAVCALLFFVFRRNRWL